jgi:hypothetical protein
MSNDLRSKVIRLAHANPALRADLLPLLKEAAGVKITNKQLNNYYAMKQGGPSANDGYNIQEYGMTYEQFRAIGRLEEEMGGADSASQFNRFLAGAKINLTRASQSDIDALAKALAKKPLRAAGCEKLPEGGMRDNCEAKVEEGEKADKKAAKAPAKLKGKKLDALISKTYSVLGNGVTINMMDISKIYNDALKAYEGAGTPEEATEALEKAMKTSIAKHKIP